MMWGMSGMGGIMVATILLWLLILAAIGFGIWWLVGQTRRSSEDRALETLRRRYAPGEITREEFEARRKDLVA